MGRYVQSVPPPDDPYAGDALLRSWLDRLLGPGGHAAAAGRLKTLAADITGPLRAAHAQAEATPPRLVRYDPWGARVDRVETSAGWQEMRAAAARHAVVALPYLPEARAEWGAAARVVQHALLHLYGPESATFSCPVAMADGAAALLSEPEVDADVRAAWLPRLLSTDPDTAITSGQWMTESQGGSDLARSATIARPAGDGSWRLTGEKWFCSAADSAMAVALARPDGAGAGSRVLAPYLVPRYATDSPLASGRADPQAPAPGVRLHRLKDKLGTRALPTAEVGLHDAYAVPLGDPAQPGLARMMTLVVVTRLHNAAAAAGGMRRGLAYAAAFARSRQVAGGRLAKLATGKLAVAAASEYVECFGGAGYVEDTGVPRLLRDAQVLPIWEGTTNVLALDVIRAVVRDAAAEPLLARLDAAADLARGLSPTLADTLAGSAAGLRQAVAEVGADPYGAAALAGARGLALRLACGLAAALLAEQAVAGDELSDTAARLWARRWLRGEDVSVDAHHRLEALGG